MYNKSSYLIHYGVPGRSGKVGAGRWYKNGQLTEEGYRHYYMEKYGHEPSQNEGSQSQTTNNTKTSHFINADGSKNYKKIKHEASKDASEYARAKAYYGDGAGTRRKKIKNLISEKMKDPDYKKAFEQELSKQDMEKHQKAANRERKTQDTKEKVKRVGRGIKNLLLGVGTTSIAAIAIVNIAKSTGADKMIANKARTVLSKIKNAKYYGGYDWHPGSSSGSSAFADFMRNR